MASMLYCLTCLGWAWDRYWYPEMKMRPRRWLWLSFDTVATSLFSCRTAEFALHFAVFREEAPFQGLNFGGWWWWDSHLGIGGSLYTSPPSSPNVGLFKIMGIVELVNFSFAYLAPLALEFGFNYLRLSALEESNVIDHDMLESMYLNTRVFFHPLSIMISILAGTAILIVSSRYHGSKLFWLLRSTAMLCELLVALYWLYRARGNEKRDTGKIQSTSSASLQQMTARKQLRPTAWIKNFVEAVLGSLGRRPKDDESSVSGFSYRSQASFQGGSSRGQALVQPVGHSTAVQAAARNLAKFSATSVDSVGQMSRVDPKTASVKPVGSSSRVDPKTTSVEPVGSSSRVDPKTAPVKPDGLLSRVDPKTAPVNTAPIKTAPVKPDEPSSGVDSITASVEPVRRKVDLNTASSSTFALKLARIPHGDQLSDIQEASTNGENEGEASEDENASTIESESSMDTSEPYMAPPDAGNMEKYWEQTKVSSAEAASSTFRIFIASNIDRLARFMKEHGAKYDDDDMLRDEAEIFLEKEGAILYADFDMDRQDPRLAFCCRLEKGDTHILRDFIGNTLIKPDNHDVILLTYWMDENDHWEDLQRHRCSMLSDSLRQRDRPELLRIMGERGLIDDFWKLEHSVHKGERLGPDAIVDFFNSHAPPWFWDTFEDAEAKVGKNENASPYGRVDNELKKEKPSGSETANKGKGKESSAVKSQEAGEQEFIRNFSMNHFRDFLEFTDASNIHIMGSAQDDARKASREKKLTWPWGLNEALDYVRQKGWLDLYVRYTDDLDKNRSWRSYGRELLMNDGPFEAFIEGRKLEHEWKTHQATRTSQNGFGQDASSLQAHVDFVDDVKFEDAWLIYGRWVNFREFFLIDCLRHGRAVQDHFTKAWNEFPQPDMYRELSKKSMDMAKDSFTSHRVPSEYNSGAEVLRADVEGFMNTTFEGLVPQKLWSQKPRVPLSITKATSESALDFMTKNGLFRYWYAWSNSYAFRSCQAVLAILRDFPEWAAGHQEAKNGSISRKTYEEFLSHQPSGS